MRAPRAKVVISHRKAQAWDSAIMAICMNDEAIATLKKNGTYSVPTLYLMDWHRENAAKANAGLSPEKVMVSAQGQNAAKKAFGAGVKIGFGTDAAVYPHRLNAHEFAV